MYIEDDILIPYKAIKYWLEYNEKIIEMNYNLGFVRIEVENNIEYITDLYGNKLDTVINLDKNTYCVNNKNPYCAFWIYDKNEFREFIKTKFWKFNWKWVTISGILLIREMATIGWHGINMNGIDMNRYLATIIPLKKGHLDKNSFIRHLSNKFSVNPAGLFGTFKIKDIPEKNLKKFNRIRNMPNL